MSIDHSGVAGERSDSQMSCCPEFARNGYSHTEICPAFNTPAADPAVAVAERRATRGHSPDPTNPSGTATAGGVLVSDETVEAYRAGYGRSFREENRTDRDDVRAGLAAAAPLIAAQALRSAYWKLREHASGLRSTEVYRRCAERAEHEQGDNARDYQRYRWLEATARGIEDAAQDIAEMLGVEEYDLQAERADELERGGDRG